MLRRTKEVVVSGGKLETLLGAGTSMTGTLKAEGNVRIEGTFEGSLEALGNVIIGQKALVKADITAKSVQVWGMVEGSIVASGRLEILRKGRVLSDVEVSALLIDDDAVFRGKCVISGATEIPKAEGESAEAGEEAE
jgi:cytoskeletal protein CcmA (bactofilin family)